MYIRKLLDDEYEKVIELIYECVHAVCRCDYTDAELFAWAPEKFDTNRFRAALDGCFNIVMIHREKIIGFLSMESDGYINRLYTHKNFLRQGIATKLLAKAEEYAKEHKVYELRLDSSKTAEPFYIKHGFTESGVSVSKHNGVIFRNKIMKKYL